MMRRLGFWLWLVAASTGFARTSTDVVAARYHDSVPTDRVRYGVSALYGYDGADYDLDLKVSTLWDRDLGTREVSEALSISATETLHSLTELRQTVSLSRSDRDANETRSGSLGASRWLLHEQVRLGLDITRSNVQQRSQTYMDVDAELIEIPDRDASETGTLSVRVIATPTTVWDYRVSASKSRTRPNSYAGSAAVRHYVKALRSALHGSVSRAVNRGTLSRETPYGEVDSWTFSGAVFRELTLDTIVGARYRYYREQERTRTFGESVVYGSDTLTLQCSTAWSARLTTSASYVRYWSNSGLTATWLEVRGTMAF